MKRPHILILRRRWVMAALALLLAAGIFTAVQYPAISVAGTQRQLPIYCVDCGEEKRCAISFDAAWGDGRMR